MEKTPLEKLEIVVKTADDRLAEDIVALNVAEVTPLANYFVIMSAKNERQLDAIVQSIVDEVKEKDVAIKDIEGRRGGKWILIDLFDVIVHVFHFSERAHYNLENIWKDAPLVDISKWTSDK